MQQLLEQLHFAQISFDSSRIQLPGLHSAFTERLANVIRLLPSSSLPSSCTPQMERLMGELGLHSSQMSASFSSIQLPELQIHYGNTLLRTVASGAGGSPPDPLNMQFNCIDAMRLLHPDIPPSLYEQFQRFGDLVLLTRISSDVQRQRLSRGVDYSRNLALQERFSLMDQIYRIFTDFLGNSSPSSPALPERPPAYLNIRLSEVKTNPLKALHQLTSLIGNSPGEVRLSVAFLEDDGKPMAGIDAGGLSRQLISDIFEGLMKIDEITLHPVGNGMSIPKAKSDGKLADAEKQIWRSVGKALKFCLYENFVGRQPLIIGPIFEKAF